MTTEMTTLHRTSPLAWHCTLSTLTSTSTESAHHERAQSFSLHISSHSHWLKSCTCPHFTPSAWPSTWAFSLHVDPLRSLLPSFPPVLLPLPLLPPQRRAAAGAQQEDHGKLVQLRDQREWGPTTSSTSPQKLYLLGKERGPMLNHKIIRPPIIQCRRNWSIFFVMGVYLEKTMERLNSGE